MNQKITFFPTFRKNMSIELKHKSWSEKFGSSLSLKNLSLNSLYKSQISSSTLYQFVPQNNYQDQGKILDIIQSFKHSIFSVSNYKEVFEESFHHGPTIVNHLHRSPYKYSLLKNFFGLTSKVLDQKFLLQIKHIKHPPFSISTFDSNSCICMERKIHNFFSGKGFYSSIKTRNMSGYSRRISKRVSLSREGIKLQFFVRIKKPHSEKSYQFELNLQRKKEAYNIEMLSSRECGSIDLFIPLDLCADMALGDACYSLG